MAHFEDLPTEIILLIHRYSLSSSLPIVSKSLYNIFKYVSNYHKAVYLFMRCTRSVTGNDIGTQDLIFHPEGMQWSTAEINSVNVRKLKSATKDILENSLLYGICNLEVFMIIDSQILEWAKDASLVDALLQNCQEEIDYTFAIPRRLFRSKKKEKTEEQTKANFIKYLLLVGAKVDSHNGYPLARALRAENTEMVKLLLSHGASPTSRNGYALKQAISKGYVEGAFMLLRNVKGTSKALNSCLEEAIKMQEWDLVDVLRAKGAVPTIEALNHISSCR